MRPHYTAMRNYTQNPGSTSISRACLQWLWLLCTQTHTPSYPHTFAIWVHLILIHVQRACNAMINTFCRGALGRARVCAWKNRKMCNMPLRAQRTNAADALCTPRHSASPPFSYTAHTVVLAAYCINVFLFRCILIWMELKRNNICISSQYAVVFYVLFLTMYKTILCSMQFWETVNGIFTVNCIVIWRPKMLTLPIPPDNSIALVSICNGYICLCHRLCKQYHDSRTRTCLRASTAEMRRLSHLVS